MGSGRQGSGRQRWLGLFSDNGAGRGLTCFWLWPVHCMGTQCRGHVWEHSATKLQHPPTEQFPFTHNLVGETATSDSLSSNKNHPTVYDCCFALTLHGWWFYLLIHIYPCSSTLLVIAPRCSKPLVSFKLHLLWPLLLTCSLTIFRRASKGADFTMGVLV